MTERANAMVDLYRKIIMADHLGPAKAAFKSYAVVNFRGGTGKTTLTFNLAYGLAQKHSVLLADLCAQKSFTDLIFTYGCLPEKNINDAFVPALLGPMSEEMPLDLAKPVNKINPAWENTKDVFMIAGGTELYNWPSELYRQLSLALSQDNAEDVKKLMLSLKNILEAEAEKNGCQKIFMDTSPFYAGGTHLALNAAEALIVPVTADKNSLDALSFFFKMLSNSEDDFLTWNAKAEIAETPKIVALIFNQVGISQDRNFNPSPDALLFIDKIMKLTDSYRDLFVDASPDKAFAVLEDMQNVNFMSQAEKKPIKLLDVNRFSKIVGFKIVNDTTILRYKSQIDYLVSLL